MTTSTTAVPEPTGAAVAVFGDRLSLARRYAEMLAVTATERGLIGPREVPRLWDRHLVNSALLADLIPVGPRVVDVGSGAGLPGIVLAIRRRDLTVDLVESLERRVVFLREAVAALDLNDQVQVHHGRAEDRLIVDAVGGADWCTARAVAPLDRLARWCLPLLRAGGTLLAIKGASAEAEITEHAAAVRRVGGGTPRVEQVEREDAGGLTAIVVVREKATPRRA